MCFSWSGCWLHEHGSDCKISEGIDLRYGYFYVVNLGIGVAWENSERGKWKRSRWNFTFDFKLI